MVATTLPLSSYQNTYNSSRYDEFGAHSIPPNANSANNWDEEMVPALRKRVEEESKRLDQRIDQHDVYQRSYPAKDQHGRQQVKPARRGEVLQDGLGSDDLIPSEWATGSTAQFTTISPRSRVKLEEKARSIGTSQHQSIWQSTAPSYLAPHSLSHSPSSASGSLPILLARDSPSPVSPLGTQSVSQAREKARRLARERELQGFSHQLQSGTQEGDYFGEPHLQGSLVRQSERLGQRSRTLSSPTARKINRGFKAEEQPFLADALHHSISKDDEAGLSASNSMPGNVNKEAPSQYVRKIQSATRLTPKPGRDVLQERSSAGRTLPMNGSPMRSIGNDTSISQDVLDEFGPLGGIPRRRKGHGWNVEGEEEGPDLSNSRSVSNAWDEELLPTVKRRLAQQKMLAELGRDDELVDTWDRHGLPLSIKKVSARRNARGERDDGDASIGLTPSASPSKITESTPVKKGQMFDEDVQRMTRLHEQLDLGSQLQSSPTSIVQHDSPSDKRQKEESEVQQVEMSEIKHENDTTVQQQIAEQQYEYQSTTYERQKPDRAVKISNQEQNSSTVVKSENFQDIRLAEADAGCCKCIIM